MRVTTIPLEGEAEAFDPENPGPFIRLAGDRLIRIAGGTALVREEDGHEMTVYRGWLVIRPDGSGDGEALFTSQSNFGQDAPRLWGPAAG
ncbi:MAG TPA: hypothetical protein VK586_23440 [Streptosporangiaceae bacterium]|nr:hypothetical protein [Streptosporangiaceae bacterium]